MHPDRYEPNLSELRDRAIRDRNQQITASQEVYHRLLRELSWAIQSIRLLGELGSGLAPPRQLTISPAREAQLKEVARNITRGGCSPHALDLATLQDANPPQDLQSDSSSDKPASIQREALARPPGTMDVSALASDNLGKPHLLAEVETASHTAHSRSNAGDVGTQGVSPELVITPQPCHLNGKPGPSREGKTNPAHLPLQVVDSTSHHQCPSAINHAALTFSASKPSIIEASPLPLEGAARFATTDRFTSVDYASQLPPIPAHIIASRLSAAQLSASKHSRRQTIRSGLWIGPGGSEITKLGIKAQHVGVKCALRKNHANKSTSAYDNAKLHNILTTADWKTMLDELQTERVLQILERLKAEKAWAFSQIKKPRIALVQKAHWDHLLDEMSWLQVDFRQERRWKIATAHRLAKQVLQWHQADSIGKRRLQVQVASLRRLDLSATNKRLGDNVASINEKACQIGPSSNSRPSQLSSLSSEAAPISPCHSIKGSPESFRSRRPLRASILPDTADNLTAEKHNTAVPEARHTSPQESRKALHQIKRSRIPIFEMTAEETLIDAERVVLDGLCVKPSGYIIELVKLHKLFVDLPVFGDLDSRLDKRPDEASPHLGRITRIAPFLEVKPLLISTLQPAKNCQRRQWRNLPSLAVEDMRESFPDHKTDSSYHHSHIFSGRKSKEAKESNFSPVTSSEPISGPREEIKWVPSDEEVLRQIALTYEFNWKIIADIFNASLSRSTNKPVTPRDCYDCWMRLNLSSESVTPHVTLILPAKSTSEPNPCMVTPQPHSEVSSAEITANDTTDVASGCQTTKRPAEFSSLFPNKRATRDDALQVMVQKVKEKRASSHSQKPVSPTQPRQIVLTAHETHAQAIRPYMTPLEMSALKAERDRQTQAALEMAKRQQQMQHESLLHQARAAAVVAAAAQIPSRNASNKPPTPLNGNIPPRLPLQPTSVSFTSGRPNGLQGITLHRQVPQAPTRYVTSPPILSIGNRVTASPMPHPSSSHQARQSVLKNQSSPVTQVSSQPPIVPQLPSMPQALRSKTPNPQSSAPGSTPIHHTPNGSTPMNNGLHNSTMSLPLTPVQVAQYIQQQHVHQQRSPEHQIHQQQHQQLLLHQQMHLFQHTHPAVPQVFGQQSPSHSHPNATTSATSMNHSTSPLISSSSPLPQPPP